MQRSAQAWHVASAQSMDLFPDTPWFLTCVLLLRGSKRKLLSEANTTLKKGPSSTCIPTLSPCSPHMLWSLFSLPGTSFLPLPDLVNPKGQLRCRQPPEVPAPGSGMAEHLGCSSAGASSHHTVIMSLIPDGTPTCS